MSTVYYSSRKNPSGLYRKAYRWAWSNLRDPKFSVSDVKTFNINPIWAWVSVFVGFFGGAATTILILLPVRFRFPHSVNFLLVMLIFFLVGPAIQAGVIWSVCMLKSIKKKNIPAA